MGRNCFIKYFISDFRKKRKGLEIKSQWFFLKIKIWKYHRISCWYCRCSTWSINLLISARYWEEALRVAFLHNREVLVSEVKNASLECASSLIDEYKEGLEKVGKYLTRYLAVRQRRLLLAAKLRSEERSINDIDDDTASEASSTFSGMSVYTTGYVLSIICVICFCLELYSFLYFTISLG